jgi:hypothetical protein
MLTRVLFLGAMVFGLVIVGATQAEVVTQYSFEGDLNDTAATGTNADNLTDNTPGVSYVAGVVGSAVAIPATPDGSNKITAADSADVRLGANWTMEAFVWPDSSNNPANEWERFWTKWGDGGEDYHLSFRGAAGVAVPDGLDLFVNGGNNIINHDSTATVPRETWSHVAFVGDQAANEITAWLNGAQVGTTAYVAVTPTVGSMSFGNFGSGNQAGLQYSGYIDEALIHNTAVDASYLAGRAALIPEPATGLLAVLAAAVFLAVRRRR